jgi:glycosyltransferase involved in cell wall biosynthesis
MRSAECDKGMTVRRVLMVAYYFPPLGGAGVQRTLKFVKYLPEFGWQPVVLTARERGKHPTDSSLEDEIPANVSVHRSSALLPPSWLPWRLRSFIARWLLVVDEQLGWLPFALRQGKRLIRQERIQAIYSTSAPYTDHLIGYLLKQHSGLPWIADFRDPWADNLALTFASRFHQRLVSDMERSIFHFADQIIVNTPSAWEFFCHKYPTVAHNRLVAITNGYDPVDFEQVSPEPPINPSQFRIVHVGSLYGQRRTARPFLKALRHVLDVGALSRKRIEVAFVGNAGREAKELTKILDLADVVCFVGYVPHEKSIASLLSASLLLLIPTSGPGSEIFLPAKIFEYLAARRPILALASRGAAADLVREAEAGVVVDPEVISAIADQIVMLYRKWQRRELEITPRQDVIARYDRRQLTGQLARILDEESKQ